MIDPHPLLWLLTGASTAALGYLYVDNRRPGPGEPAEPSLEPEIEDQAITDLRREVAALRAEIGVLRSGARHRPAPIPARVRPPAPLTSRSVLLLDGRQFPALPERAR